MCRHRAPHTAYIPLQLSASLPTSRSSNTSVSTCSRRQALRAAALPLISIALRPQIAAAIDAFGLGDAIPSDDFDRVRESVKGDVSFSDFVSSLEKGGVKRVWFFGTFKEYCCFEDADGVVRHVGVGYPVESARSPESPLHVVARVRDRNVPYYVAPVSGKYLRR